MHLRVKQGRKYYFEGREYLAGESIPEAVHKRIPVSYLPDLTRAYGPLEHGEPVANKTDLPPKVMAAAMTPEASTTRPLASDAEEPSQPARTRRYKRRDMTAEE